MVGISYPKGPNIVLDNHPVIRQGLNEIYATYGDVASVDNKAKSLRKFGRHRNLGTSTEDVWNQTGTETYPTTNAITHFSSSDAGDNQSIQIEGHTVVGTGSDAKFTFVIQTATLAGQTKTALTTPLARCTRVRNRGTTDFVGDIYVYEDVSVTNGVPGTASAIHAKAEAGENQTFKAGTTISDQDYWIILDIFAGVDRQNSRAVDFEFQVRWVGEVFRPFFATSASSNGGSVYAVLSTPLIVPKNADFRVRAISSGTATTVEAWAGGVLAKVVGR